MTVEVNDIHFTTLPREGQCDNLDREPLQKGFAEKNPLYRAPINVPQRVKFTSLFTSPHQSGKLQ